MTRRGFSLSLMLAVAAFGQTVSPNYILEMRPGTNPVPLASKYQFTVRKSWNSSVYTSYLITPAAPFTAAQIRALAGESGVLELEADSAIGAPPDLPASGLESLTEQLLPRSAVPFFGATVRASYVDQPVTRLIGLADAHSSFSSGAGVVAIIDTGVDEKHPALKSALLPGYDFTRDVAGTASEYADLDQSTVAILDQSTVAILDAKVWPVRLSQSTVAILDQSTVAILDGRLPKAFGHGTMVAGLVHLVAPSAKILPLKAFRADGTSALSNIVRAIYYAVDQGANIIHMSFSFDTASVEVAAALDYARRQGVLCVAAGGNEGKSASVYPAALPYVLGVGSTNYRDRRSPFSNFGPSTRTAAPGEAIITTFPGNNYAAVWGTSFSAPLVSGGLALMRQLDPKLAYGRARDSLDKGVEISVDMGHRLALPAALRQCILSKH